MDGDVYGPGDQLQALAIPSPAQLFWRMEALESLPTVIYWDQTNEEVSSISTKLNFLQRSTSLCWEKDMKVWQNLKACDFINARGSSRLGIHSCRRPGDWKRELWTRATSQVREKELRGHENGSDREQASDLKEICRNWWLVIWNVTGEAKDVLSMISILKFSLMLLSLYLNTSSQILYRYLSNIKIWSHFLGKL